MAKSCTALLRPWLLSIIPLLEKPNAYIYGTGTNELQVIELAV